MNINSIQILDNVHIVYYRQRSLYNLSLDPLTTILKKSNLNHFCRCLITNDQASILVTNVFCLTLLLKYPYKGIIGLLRTLSDVLILDRIEHFPLNSHSNTISSFIHFIHLTILLFSLPYFVFRYFMIWMTMKSIVDQKICLVFTIHLKHVYNIPMLKNSWPT